MNIEISTAPNAGPLTIAEAGDLKRLHVTIHGDVGLDTLAAAVARLGRLADEDHVFLQPAALRKAVGEPWTSDPAWLAEYDEMVAFAASHGWTSDAGELRAHIVRAPH